MNISQKKLFDKINKGLSNPRSVLPYIRSKTKEKFGRKSDDLLTNILIKHRNFKTEDTILIVGAPRSGTTWLMNLISSIPEYIPIIEPLHSVWYPELEDMNFGKQNILDSGETWLPRYYLAPEENNTRLKKYFARVFRGDVVHVSPNFEGDDLQNLIYGNLPSKLAIKTVRGLRLLPWLSNNFEYKSCLLVIRHPCATIASQIKSNITGCISSQNLVPPKTEILNTIDKLGLGLNKLKKDLNDIDTAEGFLAATWALDHFIPLASARSSHSCIIITYEDLLTNGEMQIKTILRHLGEFEHYNKICSKLKKPSSTAKYSNEDVCRVTKANHQLCKWKSMLTSKQISNITRVINLFDIRFQDTDYQVGEYNFPRITSTHLCDKSNN